MIILTNFIIWILAAIRIAFEWDDSKLFFFIVTLQHKCNISATLYPMCYPNPIPVYFYGKLLFFVSNFDL